MATINLHNKSPLIFGSKKKKGKSPLVTYYIHRRMPLFFPFYFEKNYRASRIAHVFFSKRQLFLVSAIAHSQNSSNNQLVP